MSVSPLTDGNKSLNSNNTEVAPEGNLNNRVVTVENSKSSPDNTNSSWGSWFASYVYSPTANPLSMRTWFNNLTAATPERLNKMIEEKILADRETAAHWRNTIAKDLAPMFHPYMYQTRYLERIPSLTVEGARQFDEELNLEEVKYILERLLSDDYFRRFDDLATNGITSK